MNTFYSLLNPENKLMNFVNKVLHLVWLNVLWLLCSIPVVTIGASTTAMYYVAMRMVRDEEGYIARDFFHSFKENFRQATVAWIILLAFFIMITVNWYACSGSPNDLIRIASFLFLSLLLIFLMISAYIFPLLSQFQTTLPELFQSAIYIAIKNIHWSFCLTVLFWGGWLLILVKLYPLIPFGLPLLAFAQSYIFNHIFRQYLPDREFTPGATALIRQPDTSDSAASEK